MGEPIDTATAAFLAGWMHGYANKVDSQEGTNWTTVEEVGRLYQVTEFLRNVAGITVEVGAREKQAIAEMIGARRKREGVQE